MFVSRFGRGLSGGRVKYLGYIYATDHELMTLRQVVHLVATLDYSLSTSLYPASIDQPSAIDR